MFDDNEQHIFLFFICKL